MIRGARRVPGLCVLAALLSAGPAAAHPHGYADTKVTFVLEGGRIGVIRVEWTFDQVYSAMLLDNADLDRDGRINEDERVFAIEDWQLNLEEFDYFTHLTLNGAPVSPVEARNLDIRFADGRGLLSYDVVISPPADPAATAVAVGVYDKEFYLFFNPLASDPVAVAGAGGHCETRIVDDPDRAYYFGQVIPKRYDLLCQ